MSELKPCPLPTFHVIDHTTGKEADEYEIALHEPWASHLCYCDMEGWAIEQDGTLILMDECNQFAYPPKPERFEVVFDDSRAQPDNEPLTIDELREMGGEPVWCVDGEGHGCYCLVNAESEDCIDSECGAWCFGFYGMTGDGENGLHNMGWLAYDHKQGGEQDG